MRHAHVAETSSKRRTISVTVSRGDDRIKPAEIRSQPSAVLWPRMKFYRLVGQRRTTEKAADTGSRVKLERRASRETFLSTIRNPTTTRPSEIFRVLVRYARRALSRLSTSFHPNNHFITRPITNTVSRFITHYARCIVEILQKPDTRSKVSAPRVQLGGRSYDRVITLLPNYTCKSAA